MKFLSIIFVVIALLGLILFSGSPAEANMIVNGGFETGDFTGWTVTEASSGTYVGVDDFTPHSGVYSAFFGATDGFNDSISQSISTIPGASYSFEFWLGNEDIDNNNNFHALWNGASVLDLTNADAFDYTRYVFTVMATGTTTEVIFSGANAVAYYNLDDVSVQPVPEPSTFLLLGAGLAAAWIAGRRLRRV